jgi:CheY-like chemotaxis protein
MVPTILVLDHNATVQRMMKLAFKDESVRVTAVRLGSDAFAAIDAHPPDIIFTENARKVVAFLKSRPNLPRIPVVLLKGAFDASTAGADEQAADEVLTKPLQPDAMIDCVKRLLEARDAAAHKVASPLPTTERVDEDLDIDKFFDQLEVAFNEADSTQAKLDGDLWDGAFVTATDDGQPRQPIARPEARRAEPDGAQIDRLAPTAAQGVSNELIDQVAQRVLDRLGERVVRSTATEVVARLSKWLLVNELEKGRSTQ